MDNELIKPKSWWKRHWIWFIPGCCIVLSGGVFLLLSGVLSSGRAFATAYNDTELYEGAFTLVKANAKVEMLLGTLEPIDNLTILEGEVEYLNNNQNVVSTIRIAGNKGKARLDIVAAKQDSIWNYTKIQVRIKTPPEKQQTISIIPSE